MKRNFPSYFDLEVKREFYKKLNAILSEEAYAAIPKEAYVRPYVRLSSDVYEIALSLIIERTVFLLDEISDKQKRLKILIEKREGHSVKGAISENSITRNWKCECPSLESL